MRSDWYKEQGTCCLIPKRTSCNSTYPKVVVQWLIEALFLVSSFVLADDLVIRNRHLRIAANRWQPHYTPIK